MGAAQDDSAGAGKQPPVLLAFHAREARAVAAEHFDAAMVIPSLLERAMSPGRSG
jgi:hypothetical protein